VIGVLYDPPLVDISPIELSYGITILSEVLFFVNSELSSHFSSFISPNNGLVLFVLSKVGIIILGCSLFLLL